MVISRRSAWFLVGLAVWNVYVWVTFVRNVYPEHHLDGFLDRKSTRLNSSHPSRSRMPSSA